MKRINKKFCLSIIFILLCSFPALAVDRVAVVVKSKTVIRQTPNLRGKVLLIAKKEQSLRFFHSAKDGFA